MLVSSDSDFTGLARRLREAGQFVIGIGEQKTPSPLIAACNKFIYIEVIRDRFAKATAKAAQPARRKKVEPKKAEPAKKTGQAKKAEPEAPKASPADDRQIPDSIIWLIADSILDLSGASDDDYVSLGAVGQLIQKKRPDFDSRSYGFSKLSGMVKAIDRFEVEERQDKSDPRSKIVYIRDLEM